MGIRAFVVLFVAYVVQLTLYFVGTEAFSTSSNALLNCAYCVRVAGSNLGTFLSSINVELQAGLAVEGLVILAMFFVHAFRDHGDTVRL